MIAVEHGSHGRDLTGKESQVQSGVALFHHAAQKAWRVDPTPWPVNGTTVSANPFDRAPGAFALGNQTRPECQVTTLEDLGFAHGQGVAEYQGRSQQQLVHGATP
jgi:hypothetical protein